MRASPKGMTITLAFYLVAFVACGGRIPGLYDAATKFSSQNDASLADAPFGDRSDGVSVQVPDLALRGDLPSDNAGGAPGDARDGRVPDSGGAGGSGGATTSCTGVVVSAATRQPADVLLVLDRSGSMYYSISEECSCDATSNPHVVCADTVHCTTRWQGLVSALDKTLSSTPYLHWGLKLFASPDGGACRVSSGVEVPPAADATAAIEAVMSTTTPLGETPTAAAISAAAAYLGAQKGGNTKMILLATDGKPNCGGSPPSVYDSDVAGTIDAITAAYKAGFAVYVVGIGTGASLANLDTFAQAGGTGSHYAADSLDGLTTALGAISKEATCTFSLSSRPLDPTKVAVYLDKVRVPRDSSNGWSFAADGQSVIMHGTFCDQALSAPINAIEALFSCDDLPLPTLLP